MASTGPGHTLHVLHRQSQPRPSSQQSHRQAVNALTGAWTCCAFSDVLHVPPPALDTAITASYRRLQITPNPSPSTAASAHSDAWTRCTSLKQRSTRKPCPLDVLRVPQLPLDGTAASGTARIASGHTNPSPSTAANAHPDARTRCTSLGCPWTALLSLLCCALPLVTANPSPNKAAHADLDTGMCCAFLSCRWTALLSPARFGSPQVIPNPLPSTAANVHSDAVDALHIPQLPLDGAAVFAIVRFAPGSSKSLAKQRSTCKS